MMEHQVPIIPGMNTPATDNSRLSAAADELGYPVIVKAAAGGGGKGMRIVESRDALAEAAETATSEALASFGDGSIYLEKYLDKPRHVEFQILADAHGNVVHLFERECSIQRRDQKIIEETPSVALTDELRDRMGAAAVTAAVQRVMSMPARGRVPLGWVRRVLLPRGQYAAPGRAPHHGTDHRTRSGSPSNRDCRWAAFAFYPGGRQPLGMPSSAAYPRRTLHATLCPRRARSSLSGRRKGREFAMTTEYMQDSRCLFNTILSWVSS